MTNWVHASGLSVGLNINLTASWSPPIDEPPPAPDWHIIADFRPQSREWPMSVAIMVEGESMWRVLPAEQWCEVDEAQE